MNPKIKEFIGFWFISGAIVIPISYLIGGVEHIIFSTTGWLFVGIMILAIGILSVIGGEE